MGFLDFNNPFIKKQAFNFIKKTMHSSGHKCYVITATSDDDPEGEDGITMHGYEIDLRAELIKVQAQNAQLIQVLKETNEKLLNSSKE